MPPGPFDIAGSSIHWISLLASAPLAATPLEPPLEAATELRERIQLAHTLMPLVTGAQVGHGDLAVMEAQDREFVHPPPP